MNQEKYIGMDVHQATISVAVLDSSGKLIMECLVETKAATIRGPKPGPTLALVAGRAWHRVCVHHCARKAYTGTQSRRYFRDGHHRPIGEHRVI